MKRHIAEFLGELAEELGWEPELNDHRVRDEHHEVIPTSIQTFQQDSRSAPPPRARPTSADLDAEVRHLRSSLDHLSSEVTYLRAEVARLKNLPAPPDATADTTSLADPPTSRPWPALLLPEDESAPMMPASDLSASPPQPAAARVEVNTYHAPALPHDRGATEPKRPATPDLSDDAGLDLFPAEPGSKPAS